MNKDKLRKAVRAMLKTAMDGAVIDAFQAILDDEPAEPEKLIWQADAWDEWFCIDSCGTVVHEKTNSGFVIDSCNEVYNAYQHKSDAEADAKYLAVIRKLRHLQRVLGGNWKPDWKDEQLKYFIYFYEKKWKIDSHTSYYALGTFYFKSRSDAEKALAELTEQEREVLRDG